MKALQGQIVLITDASHPTGYHFALECARVGARLVLWATDIAQSDQIASRVHRQFGTFVRSYQVVFAQNDTQQQIQRVAQRVLRDFPRVDVILSNYDVVEPMPFTDRSSQQIFQSLKVNLMATLWTVRAFFPRMLDNNKGHLVLMGTCADSLGAPGLADYCAAKAGIHGLCEALRDELRALNKSRLQVTLVRPALIASDDELTPAQEAANKRVLLGRIWVTPNEVASQTVRAIRKDQDQVSIPSSLAVLGRITNLMPLGLRDWLLDQTKLSRAIDADS